MTTHLRYSVTSLQVENCPKMLLTLRQGALMARPTPLTVRRYLTHADSGGFFLAVQVSAYKHCATLQVYRANLHARQGGRRKPWQVQAAGS